MDILNVVFGVVAGIFLIAGILTIFVDPFIGLVCFLLCFSDYSVCRGEDAS